MTQTAQRGVAITATAMSLLLVACGSVSSSPDAAGASHDAPAVADAPGGGGGDATTPGIDAAVPDATPPVDAASCGSSSVCVEAPQAPWQGPVVFYEDSTGATPPSCPGDYPTSGPALNSGLNGGAATCSCSCSSPTGTSCGSALLVPTGSPPACFATAGSQESLPANMCVTLTISSTYYRLQSVPSVTGGSCTPSLSKNIPSATWDKQFDVCAANGSFTSAGCGADQLCAPKPTAPFDSQICIYQSGDVACPASSAYSNRILRYADFSDTRDCATCSCGAPSGSCGGSAALAHDDNGSLCGASGSELLDGTVGTACSSVSSTAAFATYTPNPTATCTPSTGSVTGSLTPTSATTFCCLTP